LVFWINFINLVKIYYTNIDNILTLSSKKDKIFSPIKERIMYFLEKQQESKLEFFKKTGISPSNFKGVGAKSEIGSDKLVKILSIYKDINPAWLLTGEGPMLLDTYPVRPEAVKRLTPHAVPGSTRVPLYNIEAVAGVVAIFDQLAGTEPIAFLEIPHLPQCDGAVYMVGDSMYPLLKSGDIVIYKVLNNLDNLLWGEMYLLSIVHDGDQFVTVKYVKRSETPGHVTLVSYNEHHQPKDFPLESIKFAGHIKASVRINSMG